VLLALGAVLAVPFTTAHALLLYRLLYHIGHHGQPLTDPSLLVAAAVSVVSGLPALGAALAFLDWARASRALRHVISRASLRTFAGVDYRLIEGDRVALFTSGFWRPRVYVTTAAVESMSPEVQHAALLHEQAHLRAADTRWRLALALLEGAFLGLPPVRRHLDALVLQSEVAADRRALAMGAGRRPLFDAVVMAASSRGPVAALTGGCVVPRLEQLADPGAAAAPVPRSGLVAVSAWALAVPVLSHTLLLAGGLCALSLT
jgi:hypothetical protein